MINTKVNPTGLTKNNEHIQRCFEDKLMMPFLGIAMAQSIIHTLRFVHAQCRVFRHPILIFHGKQDTVSNPAASQAFFDACGSGDKSLKLFPDGYHELQHDLEYEEMKGMLQEWIAQKLKRSEPLGII